MPARPVALAVAAAALLAACTSSTSGGPGDSTAPGSGSTGSSGATSACPAIDDATVEDGDSITGALTAAIQDRDEKSFVALGTTSAVRASLTRWWANNAAVGFVTGGAGVPSYGGLTGAQLTVRIGAHSALDSIDDAGDKPVPKVPGTDYKVSLVHVGSGCKDTAISSFTPLSAAPWDTVPKLYVKKTPHVVVAGDPAAAKLIARVARLAEPAQRWIRAIMSQAGHGDYIEQQGFVVFVARNATQAGTWFRGPGSAKPKGWTADPSNVAGFEFPLGGVQLSSTAKPKQAISALPTGGSRVVITPAGAAESDTVLEGTLVHEFVHDIFRVNDLWSWGGGDPTEASTAEGAARWVEAMYTSHPKTPTTKSHVSSLVLLKPAVQSRSFSGAMPSDAQIYGAAKDADYYYDVSATGFSYLAAAYGIKFAFQCVRDAYLQGGGPFGGVVSSVKGGTITFEASEDVQKRWAQWVRGGFSTTNVPK